MLLFDYGCCKCGIILERVVRYAERDLQVCESCGWTLSRIWIKAPAFGELRVQDSDKTLGAMKDSFNKRFITSGEIDDVRHKFGKDFDDSLVGAAVDRIKKDL